VFHWPPLRSKRINNQLFTAFQANIAIQSQPLKHHLQIGIGPARQAYSRWFGHFLLFTREVAIPPLDVDDWHMLKFPPAMPPKQEGR
jgi:hypothetical protein